MTIRTTIQLPFVHPFTGMDVASALEQRAIAFADRTFMVWEPPVGERMTWTYSNFLIAVERKAAGMQARGVGAGDPVVLMLDNCPEFLLCWFACARLGAVAVDLNTMYTTDEIRHAIGVTGAVGMITHMRHVELVTALEDAVPWTLIIDEETGTCEELAGDPAQLKHRDADPSAPLCLQFTSGTTSRPKAVLFTHANALWGAKVGAAHGAYTSDDVTLVAAPLFHTAALSWLTLSTFWVGGTVVLMPKYSTSRFWDVSLRNGCTSTMALAVMLQTIGTEVIPGHRYRSMVFSMEMAGIERLFGLRLFPAWGMTEVLTNVIFGDPNWRGEEGAIGRVSDEYRARITRPDGADTAVGEKGELRIGGVRGISLFAEYLRDPAATADAFDDEGFFLTGDLVTLLPSGAIRFDGRSKEMLKVGGENVAASEIERVLGEVAGVTQAAVVGRPDPMLNEVPVAFITVAPGLGHDDVRVEATRQCVEKLAKFKVPREIHVLAELPTVTLGKIAKGQLTALAREWVPTPTDRDR